MFFISTAKIGLIIFFGWIAVILGGLAYLIIKQKDLTLISGFSKRPKEEQEYLKKSGFVDGVGKLLLTIFLIYLAAYILWIFSVPYSLEAGFSLLLLAVLAGTIWLQRFEVPHKRKKMYWLTGVFSFAVIVFIAVLMYFGLSENDAAIRDDTFVVSGMYGVEWNVNEIESVKLLDELPHVLVKSNGFAIEGHLKGRFRLEDPYGGGLLFVKTKAGPPYLYVAAESDFVILNRKEAAETKMLYDALKTSINSKQ